MANFFRQHAYFVILLNFCVDLGDGHWKKTAREALKHDLKLYQKISEKINRELMTIYEDYPYDDVLDYYFDEINKIQEKVHSDIDLRHNNEHNNLINSKFKTRHKENLNNETLISFSSNTINNSIHRWPKFEDILVAMGKRYDWKNDRWIKIKKKIKDETGNEILKKNSETFAEKHKFIYKIVKLNRAKSKRNIVIAVTAVR